MHPNIIHVPLVINGPGQHYNVCVSSIQPNMGNRCPNQMNPNIIPLIIDGPGQRYYVCVSPIQPNTCNHCPNQMEPNIPPQVINESGQHNCASSSQQNTKPNNSNQMGCYPTLDQRNAMPQGQPSSSVKSTDFPPGYQAFRDQKLSQHVRMKLPNRRRVSPLPTSPRYSPNTDCAHCTDYSRGFSSTPKKLVPKCIICGRLNCLQEIDTSRLSPNTRHRIYTSLKSNGLTSVHFRRKR